VSKAAVIAKLLVKEQAGPLLRSRAGKILILVMLFVAAFNVWIAVAVEKPAETGLRGFLHRLGVYAWNAPVILGTLLSLAYYMYLLRGRVGVLMSDAEYELLLAQPVTIGEYLVAKMLADNLLFAASMIFVYVFLLDVFPGAKPFLLALSMVALVASFISLYYFSTILLARTRGKVVYIRLACASYLALATLHSILSHGLSALYAAPLYLPLWATAYSISISGDRAAVAGVATISILLAAALALVSARISRGLYPEDLRPPRIGGEVKASQLIPHGRRNAIRHVVLWRAAKGRGNRVFLVALLAAPLIGRLLYLAHSLGLEVNFPVIVYMVAPLAAAETVMLVVQASLGGEMAQLWIYRVYLGDMTLLSPYLLAKYTMYFEEVYAASAAFLAAYTLDPLLLGIAATGLPAALLLAYASLRLTAWLSSRRRIVRETPKGLYVVDNMVVLPVYLAAFLASEVVFTLPLALPAASVASVVLAVPLFAWAERSLAGALYRCEVRC